MYTYLTYNIAQHPDILYKYELSKDISPELTEVIIKYPCGSYENDDMYSVTYMSEVPMTGLQLLGFVYDFYHKELSDESILSMFEFFAYKLKTDTCLPDVKKKYYNGEIIRMIDFMEDTIWFRGFKIEDDTWSVLLTHK